MIAYTTVGTNNLEKAAAFYDALFAEIGASRIMQNDKFINWGLSPQGPLFSVTKPYDGNEASVGNGVMISIAAPTRDAVDAVFAKAMELGGKDEGGPGERFEGFYAAYLRDLDGNKICIVCFG